MNNQLATVTLRLKITLAWSRELKQLAIQQQRPVDSIIVDAISEYIFRQRTKKDAEGELKDDSLLGNGS